MMKVCDICGQEYESFYVGCPNCILGKNGEQYRKMQAKLKENEKFDGISHFEKYKLIYFPFAFQLVCAVFAFNYDWPGGQWGDLAGFLWVIYVTAIINIICSIIGTIKLQRITFFYSAFFLLNICPILSL